MVLSYESDLTAALRAGAHAIVYHRPRDVRPVLAVRDYAGGAGLPMRAPHYSVSVAGLFGELRIAAGGVLLLDDAPAASGDVIARLAAELARPRLLCPCTIVALAPVYSDADGIDRRWLAFTADRLAAMLRAPAPPRVIATDATIAGAVSAMLPGGGAPCDA